MSIIRPTSDPAGDLKWADEANRASAWGHSRQSNYKIYLRWKNRVYFKRGERACVCVCAAALEVWKQWGRERVRERERAGDGDAGPVLGGLLCSRGWRLGRCGRLWWKRSSRSDTWHENAWLSVHPNHRKMHSPVRPSIYFSSCLIISRNRKEYSVISFVLEVIDTYYLFVAPLFFLLKPDVVVVPE